MKPDAIAIAAFAYAWARVLPTTRAAVAADIAAHAQCCAAALVERAAETDRAGLLNTSNEAYDCADVMNIWRTLAMALATAADDEAGPQPVFVEVPR